ncbi:universal stress protein [Eubacteriaceae bacterium ES3]|nr:universal stress protein [Eubacteriaceae bacterium ES3]
MKKILVPVDGSVLSVKAVAEAKKMAEAFQSDLIFLSVASGSTPPEKETSNKVIKEGLEMQEYVSKFKTNAELYLEDARNSVEGFAGEIETVLLYGDPAERIEDYLDEHEVDMIVMGSNGVGVSMLHQLLIGSVTSKILKFASQPVLIVK